MFLTADHTGPTGHIPNWIHELLDEKAEQYNQPVFIGTDPVSIPHLFSNKEDIAIAGFLSAIIAWGQRPVILRNARKLMELMDLEPAAFLKNATRADLRPFNKFVHRTFSGSDCHYFINRLASLYRQNTTLEKLFSTLPDETDMGPAITRARDMFILPEGQSHSRHFANPAAGSAAKRINMFLRWMVRKDNKGVDFGIWKNHTPAMLVCPLDVHSGNTARKLGLLKRNQNDWKAAMELTTILRTLDPRDPVKYDFALFGIGVFEGGLT